MRHRFSRGMKKNISCSANILQSNHTYTCKADSLQTTENRYILKRVIAGLKRYVLSASLKVSTVSAILRYSGRVFQRLGA